VASLQRTNSDKIKDMSQRGFGLLEVVIGTSIILVFFFSLMGALTAGLRLNDRNLRATRASFLMTEGIEVAKMLRASGWSANISPLSAGTAYSLEWTGSVWRTTATPMLIDGLYDRRLTFHPAYRDGNQDLADSGTADPGTKRLLVSVSWREGVATTTATTTTYITNLFNN
jgi:hypothetical protein